MRVSQLWVCSFLKKRALWRGGGDARSRTERSGGPGASPGARQDSQVRLGTRRSVGGQAETGGGEDRAERDRAWVLCLNTGVPLARATSGESKDKLMWRVG